MEPDQDFMISICCLQYELEFTREQQRCCFAKSTYMCIASAPMEINGQAGIAHISRNVDDDEDDHDHDHDRDHDVDDDYDDAGDADDDADDDADGDEDEDEQDDRC